MSAHDNPAAAAPATVPAHTGHAGAPRRRRGGRRLGRLLGDGAAALGRGLAPALALAASAARRPAPPAAVEPDWPALRRGLVAGALAAQHAAARLRDVRRLGGDADEHRGAELDAARAAGEAAGLARAAAAVLGMSYDYAAVMRWAMPSQPATEAGGYADLRPHTVTA